MVIPPLNILYNGRNERPREQHSLRVGHLSVTFDQGQLLNMFWRDREVVRRVYSAVRDRNWATVPLQLSNLAISSDSSSFEITFDARHRENEIDFAWKGRIEAVGSGRLSFSMEGEALSTFHRSRIGLCVLHSVEECAGKTFIVRQPDGLVVRGLFPTAITKEAPIPGTKAMAGLTYEISSGVELSIRFDGDVFQMEDQRAWTDASFKTFCTPLELPCPVQIERGTRVKQIVRLVLADHPPAIASLPKAEIVVTLGNEPVGQMPQIGLGLASHEDVLQAREVQRLRMLRIAHLRVDIRLWQPGWRVLLHRASMEARQIECSLEIAVFISNSAELDINVLLQAVREERAPVCRWLIFHCSEESITGSWVPLGKRLLRSWRGSVPVGSGTDAYFYQLMNFCGPREGLDFVSFAIQPQEHASDDVALVETLKIQGEVVNNARRLFDPLPVSVSPVTLKPRFNPNAVGTEAPPRAGDLPLQVDVRQMSLFGACWTLGSVKYLSESGTASTTYYETTGWRGVMEKESGSPLPSQFPSTPGSVFPLFHILADIGEFAEGRLLASHSSEPLKAECLAVCKEHRQRLLVGNMTEQVLPISVEGLPAELELKFLNATNVWTAMVNPEQYREKESTPERTPNGRLTMELQPYSIARIDAKRP